jgi:hypothetical protein
MGDMVSNVSHLSKMRSEIAHDRDAVVACVDDVFDTCPNARPIIPT